MSKRMPQYAHGLRSTVDFQTDKQLECQIIKLIFGNLTINKKLIKNITFNDSQ